jgi:hypothetical protein
MGLDYAVMLSADHGGLDTPERLAEQAAARGPCRCGAGAQQAFGGDRGQAEHQI